MKINLNTDKLSQGSRKNSKGNHALDSIQKTESENSFLEILESIIPSTNEQTKDLNELWTHLPSIEKKLIDAPTIENLNEYKDYIKVILDKILKRNVKLEKAQRRNRDDQKILLTSRIIDEKLQLLASTIINKNNTAFDMLKRTQDIRGLLMDIKD